MADVDAKLAGSLKQAKTNPMFFAFVAKGNEGKLLVEKKKINAKDADAAKKECGGGTIYKGRCQGEEGKMVFHVGKDVPATLSALTKKIIKQDTGLTFDVEYRIAADLATEESETEATGESGTVPPPPVAPPAPQPAAGGAEVIKRLNSLSPNIKAALAGPNKARVQTLFVSVNGLIKTSDFIQADKVLDELEPLVASSPASPASSPPQPGNSGADVLKRLNGMSANIKAALAGPNKARVQTLFVSVNGLIKNKDFVAAGTALDELEPLVANPTGVPAAATDSSAPLPANDAALEAAWERRVLAMEPKVLEAQKTRATEAKWMTMFMTAQDSGRDGDFTKAMTVLDRLEGMLSAAPKAGEAEVPPGLVKYRISLLKYRKARSTVNGQLEKLQNDVVSTLPEEAQTAQDVMDWLGETFEPIDDAIDDAISAAQNAREPYHQATRTLLQGFITELQSEPMVKHVDGNKFSTVAVEQTLVPVLTEIVANMV